MQQINEITADWQREDFLGFLVLHIGSADLNLSTEELLFIDKLLSKERFQKIQWIWSKCNDFQCITIIRAMQKKFFPGEEGKTELIDAMKKIALSDQKFSTNEEIMIRALRKLL